MQRLRLHTFGEVLTFHLCMETFRVAIDSEYILKYIELLRSTTLLGRFFIYLWHYK